MTPVLNGVSYSLHYLRFVTTETQYKSRHWDWVFLSDGLLPSDRGVCGATFLRKMEEKIQKRTKTTERRGRWWNPWTSLTPVTEYTDGLVTRSPWAWRRVASHDGRPVKTLSDHLSGPVLTHSVETPTTGAQTPHHACLFYGPTKQDRGCHIGVVTPPSSLVSVFLLPPSPSSTPSKKEKSLHRDSVSERYEQGTWGRVREVWVWVDFLGDLKRWL